MHIKTTSILVVPFGLILVKNTKNTKNRPFWEIVRKAFFIDPFFHFYFILLPIFGSLSPKRGVLEMGPAFLFWEKGPKPVRFLEGLFQKHVPQNGPKVRMRFVHFLD